MNDGKNINQDYILAKAHDTGYQRDTYVRVSINKIENWFGTSNSSNSVLSTNTVFRRDTWYHVAFTRDYNTNKVYVNGELDAYINYSGFYITENDPLKIGIYHDNNNLVKNLNRWLNGKIDDLRIYNRSLSEVEVKLLFNYGK
ncbi:LamG domain-containing protein [candidate division KSB1 bacterium]|nr:LamG domain-containing protein [candidate division KSB1 bacterium]